MTKAGTLDMLSVVFAVVLAVTFLKERPTAFNWAGIALMLIGAYCVAHKSAKPADGRTAAAPGEHRPAGGDAHAAAADPQQRPGLTAIGPGPSSAPDPQPSGVPAGPIGA